MIAGGYTNTAIGKAFNVDRRSVANHKEEHLDYEEAAIRTILEKEADLARVNRETGAQRIITKEGYLRVALQKSFDQIMSDQTEISVGEGVKIVEMLQRLEERFQDIGVDIMRAQFNAFMNAVRATVPPEMWEDIQRIFDRNLEQDGHGHLKVDANIIEAKELPSGE